MSKRGLRVTLAAYLLVIEEERKKVENLTVTVAEIHSTWPIIISMLDLLSIAITHSICTKFLFLDLTGCLIRWHQLTSQTSSLPVLSTLRGVSTSSPSTPLHPLLCPFTFKVKDVCLLVHKFS